MVTLSVCYTKFWEENRNRPSYLSAYNCYSYATPYLKTHAAGEYTNTYGGCFDGETGKNITLETERIDSASSHAARALHSQKGCSGQLQIKQIQKKPHQGQINLNNECPEFISCSWRMTRRGHAHRVAY